MINSLILMTAIIIDLMSYSAVNIIICLQYYYAFLLIYLSYKWIDLIIFNIIYLALYFKK